MSSYDAVTRRLRNVNVQNLKLMLESLRLPKTGRKADLIVRICREARNTPGAIKTIEELLPDGGRRSPPKRARTTLSPPTYNPTYTKPALNNNAVALAREFLQLLCANDTFYEKIYLVLPCQIFQMPILSCGFNLTPEHLSYLRRNNDALVLLYSLELSDILSKHKLEHTWPTSAMLSVNQAYVNIVQGIRSQQIKSTIMDKPADITRYVHQGYNYFCLKGHPCYKHGDWNYGICIAIVKPKDLRGQVDKLSTENLLPVEETKRRIKNLFSENQDVVTEQMTVSLKCPLSLKHIKIPARGKSCSHLSCFDLGTFLDFQRQTKKPNWRCVVCNSGPLNPSSIIVDAWLLDVIKTCENIPHVDHVEIFEDGNFKPVCDTPAAETDSDDGAGPESGNQNIEADDLLRLLETMQDQNAPQTRYSGSTSIEPTYYSGSSSFQAAYDLQDGGLLLGTSEENAIEL